MVTARPRARHWSPGGLCDSWAFSLVVVAPLRLIERAFDRLDHREIKLEGRRAIPARIDVGTRGTDIVTGICQTSPHKRWQLIESVNPKLPPIVSATFHLPAIESRHAFRTPLRIELERRPGRAPYDRTFGPTIFSLCHKKSPSYTPGNRLKIRSLA